MVREDLYDIYVNINGSPQGKFDKMSGGGVDSEDSFYRGSGGVRVALGGSKTIENVTVSRLAFPGRENNLLPYLIAGAGRVSMVVTKWPTDADHNPFGRPLVYKGKLKAVTPNDVDSEGNDAALIELEMVCDAVA